MSEVSERVGATCPSCSPGVATTHEVLKKGGQYTVRCVECGHVHKTPIDDEVVERDVVVSQGGDSFTASVEIPPAETIGVGDEFIVESETGIFTVRITSLETGDEERRNLAEAEEVRTIWTRDVGNVTVDLTLHPPGGTDEDTESVKLHVPGDHEFTVGETESGADTEFAVEGILIRQDAIADYEFEKLDHDGDVALAKDVKRLYGRDEGPGSAWSAW
jgi:uncharacterized Zn finger protein